jgi:hypothetical protein
LNRKPWGALTREERALETLACMDLSDSQRKTIIDEWAEGVYPDTPDGERQALSDLVKLMQASTHPGVEPPEYEALSPEDEAALVSQLAEYQKSPSRYSKERAAIRKRLNAARMRH